LKDGQKPAAQGPGSETATQATQETSKTSKGKKNTERKTRKAIARHARRAAIQEKERKRAEQAELRAKANQAKSKAKGKPDVLSAINKGPQLTPAQKARTATNADRESAGNVAFLLNESHKRDTGSLNKEQVALARECLFCLYLGRFADLCSFGRGNAGSPASFLWSRASFVQVSSSFSCDSNVD